MKIVKPYVQVPDIDGVELMKNIEKYGRTCYKSHSTDEESYKKFINNIISNGHESVVEHEKITVKILTDRGAMWDITRHRHASFSIESTRWCNYTKDKYEKELKFIDPFYLKDDEKALKIWTKTMEEIEKNYFELSEMEYKPDTLRMLLPASLATEIMMTCNLREWRHVLRLRCAKPVHPTVKQFTIPLLLHFKKLMPELFNDIPYDEEFKLDNYSEIQIV